MPWHLKTATDAATTVLIATTCLVLLWTTLKAPQPGGRTPPPIPSEPVSLKGAALKGSATAPVVVVEFADYQCPACKRFEVDTMPRLDAEYVTAGRVQWAFRHHPIEKLHPAAVGGARAANCAGIQGKFWEMHQALFAEPKTMDRESLVRRADGIGLDGQQLQSCLEETSVVAAVQHDIDQAMSLELRGTPAFLIGRRERDGRVRVTSIIPGAATFDGFKVAIDDALAPPRGWPATIVAAVAGVGGLATVLAVWRGHRQRGRTPVPTLEA